MHFLNLCATYFPKFFQRFYRSWWVAPSVLHSTGSLASFIRQCSWTIVQITFNFCTRETGKWKEVYFIYFWSNSTYSILTVTLIINKAFYIKFSLQLKSVSRWKIKNSNMLHTKDYMWQEHNYFSQFCVTVSYLTYSTLVFCFSNLIDKNSPLLDYYSGYHTFPYFCYILAILFISDLWKSLSLFFFWIAITRRHTLLNLVLTYTHVCSTMTLNFPSLSPQE